MGKNNKSDDEVFEVESIKAPWTKKYEALFIQIMDEEVKTYSSRQTRCFIKKTLKRILDEVNAKTPYEYTQEQIRNKYNTLKTLHTNFTRLCKQTGVGWDGVLGTVTAEEETWERLYKVIDKAKKFRQEGFPHYQALSRIFGGTTATGDQAHPSTKTPSGTDSSDLEFKVKEEDLDELEVEKKNPKEKKNIRYVGLYRSNRWYTRLCKDPKFQPNLVGRVRLMTHECANNPSMRFPLPPEGKYYVVDSGYQNMPRFMSPYKGERYHLENFRGRANRPRKVEEWFNYRHSSLRNVIERCFGVLKARFPILSHMPEGFKVKTQKYIPTACCTVHNYIRMYDENDPLFLEYGVEDLIVPGEGPTPDPGTHKTQQINITPAQLRKMQ